MDYQANISITERDNFNCDNCGAEFSVTYTKQTGHNETEELDCPECGKRYYVSSSLPILSKNINLISPRTDGKTDIFLNQNFD